MAGTSLLTLLDDIATLLDDVAAMSKVAVKKTAGVLGDDLALNAQQVTGVSTDRELPVVWAVAKGSLRNKAILVPLALLISFLIPWLITPLLMIGGAYLCFEGFEKVFHKFFHSKHESDVDQVKHEQHVQALTDPSIDVVALEAKKVQGAIRTDFILSAEIIVISLGLLAESTFIVQISVLISIALIMTAGVYGLVAGIVKLDDLGLYMVQAEGDASISRFRRSAGLMIIRLTPYLMRGLGIAGTVAMFLVGGGIIMHGIKPMHDALHHFEEQVADVSSVLAWFTPIVVEGLVGVATGGAILAIYAAVKKVLESKKDVATH